MFSIFQPKETRQTLYVPFFIDKSGLDPLNDTSKLELIFKELTKSANQAIKVGYIWGHLDKSIVNNFFKTCTYDYKDFATITLTVSSRNTKTSGTYTWAQINKISMQNIKSIEFYRGPVKFEFNAPQEDSINSLQTNDEEKNSPLLGQKKTRKFGFPCC